MTVLENLFLEKHLQGCRQHIGVHRNATDCYVKNCRCLSEDDVLGESDG